MLVLVLTGLVFVLFVGGRNPWTRASFGYPVALAIFLIIAIPASCEGRRMAENAARYR